MRSRFCLSDDKLPRQLLLQLAPHLRGESACLATPSVPLNMEGRHFAHIAIALKLGKVPAQGPRRHVWGPADDPIPLEEQARAVIGEDPSDNLLHECHVGHAAMVAWVARGEGR